MRASSFLVLVAAAPFAAVAQRPAAPAESVQLAQAVLPLPAEFRENASVLGYKGTSDKIVSLRPGKGPFTCISNNPGGQQFHVACYHNSMEAFMARGRELRESGVKGDAVDSTRFREARTGKLKVPAHPAALYSLTGGKYDEASNSATGARALFVVYMPGGTPETTGLSAKPAEGTPWIMFPGTPKAHIMFVPKM